MRLLTKFYYVMTNILSFKREKVREKYKNLIKACKRMAFKRIRHAPRTEFLYLKPLHNG